MITRAEVNLDIAEKITDKTVLDKVSNVEDGGNRVLMMDYLDQEVIYKVQKTIISSAQILDLFTTPITVLDSSAVGIVNIPISIYIKRSAGSAYSFSSAFLLLANEFNTNVSTLSATLLTNTTDGFVSQVVGVAQTSSADTKSNFYKLKVNTANPTGGTGAIDVYVTYVQIAL